MLKRLLTFLSVMALCQTAYSAHLVGGEVAYECLGNNNYEITLTIYRDCNSSGAPFDANAVITIFDGQGNQIANLLPPIYSQRVLPPVAPNNCTVLPNSACTEKAIYKDTITLAPISTGYTITHQRCCRNATISNIPTPGDWGNTYTVSIPPNDFTCNSSPNFNVDPPLALCLQQKAEIDFGTSETDGDSLFYSLCELLHGGGKNTNNIGGFDSPRPNPVAGPPYAIVPFNPFRSATNPIPAAPAFQINSQTGLLTGTPVQIGQFVFAVCVEEWRNGQLLSTIRRDFQFNVTGACQAIISRIEDQNANPNNLCAGKTISFQEDCINASTYYWDFGDPTTTNDNSTSPNPTYTYADTGKFTIMLIANPNSSCADTSFTEFHVVDPPAVTFSYSGNPCVDVQQFSFTSAGDFTPTASYTWDFGGSVLNSSGASQPNVSNVTWANAGTYTVTVSVEENGCTSTYSEDIQVHERPQLQHSIPLLSECLPVTVSFKDSSTGFGNKLHYWDFGDGQVSADASPTHTYTTAGIYDVAHTVITTEGCKDTLRETVPLAIEALPVPNSYLEIDKEEATILDPFFTIRDTTNPFKSETYVPGTGLRRDLQELNFKIQDTGNFELLHITYNEFGCPDTLRKTLRVYSPLKFYIPNAFTPNGDGLNDAFNVYILGVNDFSLKIFDRWGKQVFETTDQTYVWNGKMNNTGKEMPIGIYWYLVKVKEKETGIFQEQNGLIRLLR